MKKNYFFTVQLYAILFLALQGMFLPIAKSQTNEPVSVGPSEHFFDNTQIVRQKPTQYLSRDVLSQNEMHVLNALTPQERKSIEEAVDPPAIGVVRDLKEPIRFTLNAMDIPTQGERSVSGGRLARINNDTLVWTTYIKSETAEELRIFFSEGNFPAGVLVNLFSKDNYAFNQAELRGQLNENGFYTTTTFADYVIIQVVIPVSVLNENLYFVIPKVIHADTRYMLKAPNTTCYEDVNCAYANSYPNIEALKESTSQLTFVVSGLYYICSGSLLNDIRAADWQPFLLTAHHCFSTQASASSLEARFDLFTTSCNGATNGNIILINGSGLLATNSQSDFTLVLLNDNPSGSRYYLGWTTGGVANDDIVHSVNHPGGIPQKYMRGQNKTAPDFSCAGLSTSNFNYTRALGGESEGGSSGGNLVNAGCAVVGQLYGWCYLNGATTCDYPTFYNVWGKFEVSYNNNNLQYWLYNGGSSVSMSTTPSSLLTFATLNVGTYQNLSVTVYNTGTVPNYLNLEAGTAYISGTDASQFSIIGPSFLYLPPNTSGTFTVRFTPTSSGTKTALFNIPHNANNIASPRVITLTGYAAPCSNIISLGSGGSANSKTYSKSGTGLWYTSWPNPCGYQCPGNEQIYSFVAPYTGYYSIQVTSSNSYYIDYLWKAANCDAGTWNCIADVYSLGTYGSVYWTAGNTYYILADAESTNLTTQTFFVFLNPCLNTTSIGGTGAGYTQTYNGGGNGAWYTNSAPCGGWSCPGIENVYSFVAPYTGYYSIQVTSTTEYYVDYMWSTSCGSTGWNCIQDVYSPGTYGAMYWTAGTTYYILLDDEDSFVGPQTFYINPPNPCLGITPMACGQAVEFAGGGPGVWNTYTCYFSCPGVEHVYSFVAPTTGQYSIQVNAAGTWVDYMWSTSCSSGFWNCISYIHNPGQYGSMSWTAGTTYYILLDDEDNAPGLHSFSIVCPTLCHDCPTYDFLITPDISWQTHSSSHDAGGCKIYRFYAYSGYHYTFKTGCDDGATANYDTYLQLFDAGCVQVASDDDGCGYPLSKIDWTAGSTGYYYLKVRGYSSYYFGNYTLAYNTCYTAPVQPGAISGPTTVISGIAQAYSIPAVPGATSYSWTFSGVGVPVGSGTSITLTPTGSGLLSVVANNSCGSSPASTLSITVLPVNLTLQNIMVIPGSSVCYAAGQTIMVAGGNTIFFVPNGSSVELVAGQNILFYPGTLVQSGGYLLGRISTDGNYCTPVVTNFAVNGEDGTNGNNIPTITTGDSFFKVYPNPTTGNFILELNGDFASSIANVEVFGMRGEKILTTVLTGERKREFSLSDRPAGIYFIRVISGSKAASAKIIKQ